jgi:cyclic pyranopterin phosphate synthase
MLLVCSIGNKTNESGERLKFRSREKLSEATHLAMVDISNKPEIFREATASGTIKLRPSTIELIRKGKIKKGDPIYAAKLAGIRASKETSTLIPLCHPLALTSILIDVEVMEKQRLMVTATVRTKAQTGVEMEALVATTVGLLTIWDMVKQYEKDADGQYPTTIIENVRVIKKVKETRRRSGNE